MAYKASIPKGTRDFLPAQMQQRNYIFDTIRKVFANYGFVQIETPAMEKTETLMGKYGEEGDRLIFKIFPRGEKMSAMLSEARQSNESDTSLTNKHAEEALRYDLTVPFARFIVQHQNEINFPFRRYQIQPVWRADRPQKGRYREFFQCDADIIGSDSLLSEIDLIKIIDNVFNKLNINIIIKINNRKILSGIAEVIGEAEKITDITVAIDKLDKIGEGNVIKEMQQKGISAKAIEKIKPLLSYHGNTKETLAFLNKMLVNSAAGKKGISELNFILDKLKNIPLKKAELKLDTTLARGLNYYTGAIIEVAAKDVEIGSVCGGGRYDNLTSIFGLENMSGVGIAFGADRIHDALTVLNKFPNFSGYSTTVLFINFGEKEADYCLSALFELREKGISAEIYPDNAKMKKQMKYANDNHIPFVIMAGETEMQENNFTLKNMETGEQKKLDLAQIIARLEK